MPVRIEKRELREVVVSSTVTCDRCGQVIVARRFSDGNVDEVEISRRTGYSFSGDGSGKLEELDVCGACWTSVLRPALEAAGFKFQERDWDA